MSKPFPTSFQPFLSVVGLQVVNNTKKDDRLLITGYDSITRPREFSCLPIILKAEKLTQTPATKSSSEYARQEAGHDRDALNKSAELVPD
mmetsp:Transcript_18970/g.34538  ORF Transcript_18970/g.34538 Transcript_18970/m.34538 type:complete len:90 (-) Transcript_18970:482-751(-)